MSLLVAIATAILWWRCEPHASEGLVWAGAGTRLWAVGTSHGRVIVQAAARWPMGIPLCWREAREWIGPIPWLPSGSRWLGFEVSRNTQCIASYDGLPAIGDAAWGVLNFRDSTPPPTYTTALVEFSCPLLYLVVLASLPPALLAMAITRRSLLLRRRLAKNLCAHCGYDLRATLERCPECGKVPGKVQSP